MLIIIAEETGISRKKHARENSGRVVVEKQVSRATIKTWNTIDENRQTQKRKLWKEERQKNPTGSIN